MRRHVLVVGPTRRGKSLGILLPVLRQQIRRGLGLLLLTFKVDRPLFSHLLAEANSCQREGDVFFLSLTDPEATGTFNPFAHPDPLAVAEALAWAAVPPLATSRFYGAVAHEIARLLLEGAQRRGEVLDVLQATTLLDGSAHGPGRRLVTWLSPYPDLLERAKGIRWDVAGDLILLLRRLAPYPALVPGPGRRELDLQSAVRSGGIVLVCADSMGAPQASAAFGRLLVALFAASLPALGRAENAPLFLLAVDEVRHLVGDHLVSFLSKAGGFGVGALLATQTVADLQAAAEQEGMPGLWRQITEGVGSHVVLAANSRQEAAYWAGMAGTILHKEWYESPTGVGWRPREVELVHPNVLLSLPFGVGLAYVPRSSLWREGSRSALYPEWDERREAVIVQLAFPGETPPAPAIAGGLVVGVSTQQGITGEGGPPVFRQSEESLRNAGGPKALGRWED